jgi:hypothetical protein
VPNTQTRELSGRASVCSPSAPAAVRAVVIALPSMMHSGRPVAGSNSDRRLVRLAAAASVAGPEAGRLEAEQFLLCDVARLDAEYAAGMELFAHHREDAPGAPTSSRKASRTAAVTCSA